MSKLPLILGTGLSCSLKSTISRQIAEELGLVYVECDELMLNAPVDVPGLGKAIFGADPLPNDKGNDFLIRHYEPLTREKERLLFELTKEYVDRELDFIINNPTIDFTLHPKYYKAVIAPKSNPRGVIAEWAGAGLLSHWKTADMRILFDIENPEERIQQIANKVYNKEGLTQYDIPHIRIDVHSDFIKNLSDVNCHLLGAFNDTAIIKGKQQIYKNLQDRQLLIRIDQTIKENLCDIC